MKNDKLFGLFFILYIVSVIVINVVLPIDALLIIVLFLSAILFGSVYTVIRYTHYKQLDRILTMAGRHITNGIVITNKANKIIYVNESMLHMSGYKRSELLGQDPKIFNGRHESNAFYKTFWQTLKEEGAFSCDLWDKKKDGSLFLKHLDVYALKGPFKKIHHYISIQKDVSDEMMSQDKTVMLNSAMLEKVIGKYIASDHKQFYVFFGRVVNQLLVRRSYNRKVYNQAMLKFSERLNNTFNGDAMIGEYDFETPIILVPKDYGSITEVIDMVLNLSKSIVVSSEKFNLEIKYGVSSYPENGKDAETLLINANTALADLLKKPGNMVSVFNKITLDSSQREMQLASALKEAITLKQFSVHYQPQVDIFTHKVNSLEALIRWHSPIYGNVSPAEFISIAEWYGYIDEITLYVLDQVLEDIKVIHTLDKELVVSINLSTVLLRRSRFIEVFKEHILAANVNPNTIELEVTENIFIDADERAVKKLNDLKAFGVSLALDDFGNGYSSFKYLREMPFDKLKFDREFVDACTTTNHPIIKAMTQLSKDLNMQVVAEGVETLEALECIKAQGCDQVQGYYFSKPLPLTEVMAYIKRSLTDQTS